MANTMLRAKIPFSKDGLEATGCMIRRNDALDVFGYMMCNMDKFFNKEEKPMIATTYASIEHIATPEEIKYEQDCKKARDEAEDKIAEIRLDLSKTLAKLKEDYHEQIAKKSEANAAKMWRRRYDALIEAGFSEARAWEMTMKSFELD